MENFFLGIKALLLTGFGHIWIVLNDSLTLGFIIGFFCASVVHLIILLDRPSHFHYLMLRKKAVAFEKIYTEKWDHITTKHPEFLKLVLISRLLWVVLFLLILLVCLFLFAQ